MRGFAGMPITRLALVAVPLLLLVAVAFWAPSDDHGGAFTGPCVIQSHTSIGPAARLVVTDYGPPVSVGHITVAYFDATDTKIGSTRVTVGAVSDLIVWHRESHTFLVRAPRAAARCQLADWGETSRRPGEPA